MTYVFARKFHTSNTGIGAISVSDAIGPKTAFFVGLVMGAGFVYAGIALIGVQGIKDKISDMNKKYQYGEKA